ncbi:UDP-N-acetylgalactosamine-undecaprenyl-phosphate N-acetylgalactosaminephosphotransferase [bacterium HR36]|nr:UDP-N-acetylgalactosamine-undecaprenyl-phosphate N-acetylgalactosaminephosphotransferase [bacterium HR36]
MEFLEHSLALALLLMFSPLLAIIMMLITLTSPGPAIYRQVRVGHNGRLFTLFKLRTMYSNCEQFTGPRWSVPGDPRVTPIGRFLRASHLDEIPQLLNVLHGEMAFVGPRPERPEFVIVLTEALPEYTGRLRVKPGITGLAQIQLPPDTDLVSVQKKLTCDLYYVWHQNFWLDLRILIATALRMCRLPVTWTLHLLKLPRWDYIPHQYARLSRSLTNAATAFCADHISCGNQL